MARGRRPAPGGAQPALDLISFAVRLGLLYDDDERVEPEDLPLKDLREDRFDLALESESFCELVAEVGRNLPGSPAITILENAMTVRVRVGDGEGAQEVSVPFPPGSLAADAVTGEEIERLLAGYAAEISETLRAARAVAPPRRSRSLGQALGARARRA